MLKLIGMVFIVAGAGGVGRYLANCQKIHVEQLMECREIFMQMDAGREYLKLPYAQLLRRTAKGRKEVFAKMLYEIADEMEKNKEARAAALWERAFLKREKLLFLKEEEKDLFLALAESLMLEGDHTQTAKMYFMQAEDKISSALKEKKEKQKLYGTVSILGGLFLVILLL